MSDLFTPVMWGELIFSDCFTDNDVNDILQDLARAIVTPDNVTAYSSDLLAATKIGREIDTDGLVAVATALSKIVAIRNSSSEVTANVIRVVDNVLAVDNDVFVDSVEFKAPTEILYALEDQVTLFQEGPGNNLTVIGESLTVVALQLPKESLVLGLGFAAFSADGFRGDSRYFEEVVENGTMIYFDTEDIPRPEIDASIYLPEGILNFLPPIFLDNDSIPISFFVFEQSKLFQSEDQPYDIGPERRLAVGTSVISATVEGVVIEGLPPGQEVETVFLERNVTRQDEQVDNRTCVFWEETSLGGRWSSEGCRREDLPDVNRIRCLCDHLTSFAVLLDLSGDIGHHALDLLGIIGCVISIVCLIITIVTYLSMKKLRSKQPLQILVNLCLALLGLYLVFVIGIDRRYPTVGCLIVGLLIHYFLLASMSWMAVEAVNMYLCFVKVFDAHVSKFMQKACLCAWGLPLLVCIIIAALDHSVYLGDKTYCFVSPGPALYFGVLLLVAVLLLVNFVIFALVLKRLTCRKTVAAHKADQGATWRRVQNAVAITVLLGLTWIFGFLAIGGARFILNILFLLFNSLQGFFVFVMFCLRQKEVRDQWWRWLRCQFDEERPGQVREEKAKTRPTSESGSGEAFGTAKTSERSANSSSLDPESIQLSSGGTLSTNAPSASA
ncbi:adhesion G-protein coupled receptor G2-like [Diadema setosum]|uniref:adhesion G-protein coupled receptor G2-like n=1 Tax=Diadema setosum TaxID=31175 RepID=UPI003B3BC83F